MLLQFNRAKENPIIKPGVFDWRRLTVFNPAAIMNNGKFYILERAAGSIQPHKCHIGLLESEDGIHFRHVCNQPVLTPDMIGIPNGSIQDPRVVKIDGLFYMTFAVRPYALFNKPPKDFDYRFIYPEWHDAPHGNVTRSGIAVSKNLIDWKFLNFVASPDVDDRNNILFPEKINGKYALLRRPQSAVDLKYKDQKPSIWISYSLNLHEWSEPEIIAGPEWPWEGKKIGASTPPVKTNKGWLLLYHGVDENTVYRVGAMMLDLNNPQKVIARTPDFIFEPQEQYEKMGLIIPNVVFPTGAILKDSLLYMYYGCTDTSIGLATVSLQNLVEHVMLHPTTYSQWHKNNSSCEAFAAAQV